MSKAAALRTRLARKPILVAPGVYDALTGLLAKQAGFEAVFVSGSALAYAGLARPDVSLLTSQEVALAVERVSERIGIPVLADADSGYGNAVNLQRTVRMLERAGAAAIQIEDQLDKKTPATLTARPLVSIAEMVGKIKAAQDARANDATIVSARSDAAITFDVEEALKRVEAYVQAGADMVFAEGLGDLESMKRLVSAVGGRAPILHNVLEGGRSAVDGAGELEALGYSMCLFPGALIQTMAKAGQGVLTALKRDGSSRAARDAMLDAPGLNALIESPKFLERAKRFDAKNFES
jgi:2-methylisocitrate lyase-like PEP mutase family enzyme